jgi:CRISPR-associated endonuclease/helicase Cas3
VTLSRVDFADFFAAVRDGQRPFAWQERLLDHLLEHGRWPDRIVAPTGAGKTAVVDVHVFANALRGVDRAPRIPRRLALVVDRRVVVDSHYQHALRIADRVAPSASGICAEVARALHLLTVEGADSDRRPVTTVRLRGGSPAPRRWRDEVDACAVLSCTPDMWGSRVLMRGYGSARGARSRDAALLAMDAAVVVDEAHLSRQLLLTARRVADLQTGVRRPLGVPNLQVVETTATPDPAPGRTEVGVEDRDLTPDDPLTPRMTRPKPVSAHSMTVWPIPDRGVGRMAAVRDIVDLTVRLRDERGPTVGCVVNTVALAVDVAHELRRRGRSVELLVGRLRPADVDRLRRERPGLLDLRGNPDVDVLVATQTVEVGIDLDLSALVTELAPGTAVAQRAGRVNRVGRREFGPVAVVGPAQVDETLQVPGPYVAADLAAAARWLGDLGGVETGLAPWTVRLVPPPAATPRRIVYQRLELADTWQLARTSGEQFADPDLDLWLSDDLQAETDVGLVARLLPPEELDAISVLRLTPPEPHEVFAVTIAYARGLVERLAEQEAADASRGVSRPLVAREGEVSALADLSDVRPGDVVVLRAGELLVRAGVPSVAGEECADDVFEVGRRSSADTTTGSSASGSATLRVGAFSHLEPDGPGSSAQHSAIRAVVELSRGLDLGKPTRAHRALLSDALVALVHEVDPGPLRDVVTASTALLRGRLTDADVVPTVVDGALAGLVIVDRRRATADDDLRQTWSGTGDAISLDEHQAEVGRRAHGLALALDLAGPFAQVLLDSGLHHDDGKADPRFQAMLRWTSATDGPPLRAGLLAKSTRRTVLEEQRARAMSEVVPRWRHEQLSAALVWSALDQRATPLDPTDDRALVTRLVGTTHGHGRSAFPHGATTLVRAGEAGAEAAVELFDVGRWDDVVESTDLEFGVWGTAYLEAVLRAADGAVSAGAGSSEALS